MDAVARDISKEYGKSSAIRLLIFTKILHSDIYIKDDKRGTIFVMVKNININNPRGTNIPEINITGGFAIIPLNELFSKTCSI